MDVSAIASLATSMSQTRLAQEVSMAVLKKALDAQASSGLALVQALPQPVNLPANLGQNINITA
jgi:hypothetical protein